MKKIFLMVMILGLVFGCATGPPVKSPQYTETTLPEQYRIEDIRPIKDQVGDMGWAACVDMVLNFYGRPLDGATKTKAMALNLSTKIAFGQVPYPVAPGEHYSTALKIHGFKTYTLYDQSPNGAKIKYFLTQGHPVVMMPRTETEAGPKGRFILLTGYDNSREIFFVHDPTLGEAIEMTYREFMESVPMIKAWADESKTMRIGTIIYPKN